MERHPRTAGTEYFDVQPLGQYYVASEDQEGDISSGTSTISVDTVPPVPAPSGLTGTPLDSGVALTWSNSVRLANTSIFSYYRVYSEQPSGSSCPAAGSGFGLEGTSVSEDFVVTGIANGTPVCYGVTTVSMKGQESALSPGSWRLRPRAAGPSMSQRIRKRRRWSCITPESADVQRKR